MIMASFRIHAVILVLALLAADQTGIASQINQSFNKRTPAEREFVMRTRGELYVPLTPLMFVRLFVGILRSFINQL